MNNELSRLMEDLADESAATLVAGSCAMIAREDGDWHDTTTMRGDANIDFVRAMQYLHLRNRITRHPVLPHLVRIACIDGTDPVGEDVNHNPPRADIAIIAGHASASTCADIARAAQNVWLWLYTAPTCSEPMVRYCPGCGSIGPIPKAYRDCCPDGAEARLIPQAMAEKCRDTFKVAIKAMMADAAANDISLVVPHMPEGWRERFSNEVYDNLAAADNQDVPLEEYPARILAILDSIAVAPTVANQSPTQATEVAAIADRQQRVGNVAALRDALKFYADRDHFMLADESAWDTVSGEPQNLWCDEAGTAMVEDGSIARAALAAQKADVGGAPKYRLLGVNDIIQAGDEFIGDDGATWSDVGTGVWIGMHYTHALKSARRQINAATQQQSKGPGDENHDGRV